MYKSHGLLSIVLLATATIGAQADSGTAPDASAYPIPPAVEDRFGRVVRDAAGTATEYDRHPSALPESSEKQIHTQVDRPRHRASKSPAKKGGVLLKRVDSAANTMRGITAFPLIETWRTGILGDGVGLAGIVVADVDGDGSNEVLSAGARSTFGENKFWYELVYRPATTSYDINWISDIRSEGISVLRAFDIGRAEAGMSVFLGLESGEVEVLSGVDYEAIGTISTAGGRINQILVADADNDGSDDIVICTLTSTYLADPSTLAIIRQVPHGGTDCAVGNVDNDLANELVLSSGKVIEVTSSIEVEWEYQNGEFGYWVELSNLDDDSPLEVVGASRWYHITAFDVVDASPIWQISTDLDINELLLEDVTGDGVDELIYGDGQWGRLYAYDTRTVQEIWSIDNPEHGVAGIAIGDSDNDGVDEFLYASGYSSTGPDQLAVHRLSNQALEWRSRHHNGNFLSLAIDDGDRDGGARYVVASQTGNSGYGDGVARFYDASTNRLRWEIDGESFPDSFDWEIRSVTVGDLNGDGSDEVVVGSDHFDGGTLHILDSSNGGLLAKYSYDDGSPLHAVALGDVDSDGAIEIVAGGGREHTGAEGVFVYIIDSETGEIDWRSVHLGEYWSSVDDVIVANVDDDPNQEIIAVNGSVFIIDGISHVQWQSVASNFMSIDTFDVTGDGRDEVFAGTEDGHIVVSAGESHDTLTDIALPESEAVHALEVFRLASDGTTKIAFFQNSRMRIYDLAREEIIFESSKFGDGRGNFDLLHRADDSVEVLIGTDYSLHQLTSPDVEPDSFQLDTQVDVPPEATVYSNVIVVGGVSVPVAVSVAGGEYSTNGGGFTSLDGTVHRGDGVQVRHVASSELASDVVTTLTIGAQSAAFRSTTITRAPPPDEFSFSRLISVDPNTIIYSDTIVVSGITEPTSIHVTGGEYSVNGGAYTIGAGVIDNGDAVQLRHISSNQHGTTVTTTVKIGGVAADFSSQTVAETLIFADQFE